jgi:prepilin-type N-terminal cleavage/methylation domain-containing protein
MERKMKGCNTNSGGRSRRTGFTLIELLVVISIIGVIAGLLVGLAGVAGPMMKKRKVEAELNQYTLAIDNFKARYGHYPLDNRRDGTNYSTWYHQLFYELHGVDYDPSRKGYIDPITKELLYPDSLVKVIGARGFENETNNPSFKKFISNIKKSQMAQVSTNNVTLTVLVAGVDGPAGKGVPNPWNYNCSSPVNNPSDRYDLWVDIVVGKNTNRIGNWKR